MQLKKATEKNSTNREHFLIYYEVKISRFRCLVFFYA